MNMKRLGVPKLTPGSIVDTALDLLGRFSRSDLAARPEVHKVSQKVLYEGTRAGFKLAAAGTRSFKSLQKMTRSERPAKVAAPAMFDLTPTEEQEMFRESMSRFAADRLRPSAAEANEQCETPSATLRESAELGTLLLSIPEGLGGMLADRGIVSRALVAEALSYGDMGQAVACLAPAGVASVLAEWGTAEQQSTYLTALAGEKPPAASLAVMEPRPLFSPFLLETTARTVGDDVILNGIKTWVPLASSCELFLVAAQSEQGPSLYIVESSAEGLRIEAEPGMGIRAAGMGRLYLEDVRVPVFAELTDLVYKDMVHRSRLAWCALACGTSRAVLDYVIPYCNDRKAFGEAISNRQAVAFMVANIGLESEGMRLLTWRAASLAEQGKPYAATAQQAHLACVEQGMQIGSDGVQLLGGHGYIKEHPVERWYRDLRAIGVMEGGLLI